MQHLGYSPTAEAGNDRYHELVAPLLMARQPANLVRMPFSTPATLAQACRKLAVILLNHVVQVLIGPDDRLSGQDAFGLQFGDGLMGRLTAVIGHVLQKGYLKRDSECRNKSTSNGAQLAEPATANRRGRFQVSERREWLYRVYPDQSRISEGWRKFGRA